MLRLGKELHALRLPWILALLAAGYIPLNNLIVTPWDGGVFTSGFAYFVFVASVSVACALVFGTEFQHRTLPLLLSQPMPRSRLWLEKMAALLTVAGTIAVVFGISLLYVAGSTTMSLEASEVQMAFLFLVVLVCSAGYWTMVARSTIGGAVLSLFGICMAGLVLKAVFNGVAGHFANTAGSDELEPHQNLWPLFYRLMLGGGVLYSAGFFWLGWRKFAGFDLRAGSSSQPPRVADRRAVSSATPAWLRMRPDRTISNLIRKEICLQLPLVKVAALFSVCWLAAVGVSMLPVASPGKFETFLNILTLFYIPLALVLAGAISLGEEKTLGLHAWHLTLPVSLNVQWALKLLVAAAMGIVLGLSLPWCLAELATGHLRAGLQFTATNPEAIVVLLLSCLAGLCASFWAATLLASLVRAALGGLIVLSLSLVCFALASYFADRLELGLTSWPLNWLTVRNHLPPYYFINETAKQAALLSAFFVALAFALAQSRLQMRRPQHSTREVCRSSMALAGVLFTLCFLANDFRFGVLRQGQSMLYELQQALASLPAPETGTPPDSAHTVGRAELVRNGRLNQTTLRWLDGVRIETSRTFVITGQSRKAAGRAELLFPNGERVPLLFFPDHK